jgi:hypothetical protein
LWDGNEIAELPSVSVLWSAVISAVSRWYFIGSAHIEHRAGMTPTTILWGKLLRSLDPYLIKFYPMKSQFHRHQN